MPAQALRHSSSRGSRSERFDPLRYFHTSENPYALEGDPSEVQSDPCITGHWQPSVAYGCFTMFRPPPGEHAIVRHNSRQQRHRHDLHLPVTVQ